MEDNYNDTINNNIIDNIIRLRELNQKDICECQDYSNCYLDIDINLIVTAYCLNCGGIIEEKNQERKAEKEQEEVGIPQLRKMRRQDESEAYKKLRRTKDL